MANPISDEEFIRSLKGLCALHCTAEECASFFGHYSAEKLSEKVKRLTGLTFKQFSSMHRGSGKISLRRMQWKAAEKGNISMLMFLGKQYLDQSDKTEVTNNPTNKHERLLKYINDNDKQIEHKESNQITEDAGKPDPQEDKE